MKKSYTKPVLYIENFGLCQSIAANCGKFTQSTTGRPAFGDKNTCGWTVGNYTIWIDSKICSLTVDADTDFEGYCYNNPSNTSDGTVPAPFGS